MVLRIGFAPRRRGMSTEQFVSHWRTEHADAAARLPGLQRYVQLHPVLVDGVHALGHPGFDACSMLEFADLAAMDSAFASRAYLDAVVADEARLIDKRRFGLFLGAGSIPATGPAPTGCWLVTFLRRHPAVAVATLVDTLRHDVAVGAQVVGRTVVTALDEERPGRQARIYDAVEVLQFADRSSARRWIGSADAEAAILPLAGLTAGTTRLLAEPFPVV